eukprot:1036641-Amorphochlora_amoeboformis.AAC.1
MAKGGRALSIALQEQRFTEKFDLLNNYGYERFGHDTLMALATPSRLNGMPFGASFSDMETCSKEYKEEEEQKIDRLFSNVKRMRSSQHCYLLQLAGEIFSHF